MTIANILKAANQSEPPASHDAEINAAIRRRARELAGGAIEDPVGRIAVLEAASMLTVALAALMPDPVAAATELLAEHSRNTLELLDASLAAGAGQS